MDKVEYKGKKYDVKYLMEAEDEEKGRGELTVAFTTVDTFPVIAIAERSPLDEFDPQQALTVATGRLQKKLKKME